MSQSVLDFCSIQTLSINLVNKVVIVALCEEAAADCAILFRVRNRRIIHPRESRWSEKYINYAGSSGGSGGLWRRDCKLVRIKVMNINHGRLVLRSFPALDGLSPLHRPYRLPRSQSLSLVLQPCRPSSILHREENWPTPSGFTCAHTPPSPPPSPPAFPSSAPSPRSSRVRCSSSRCQSAGPLFTHLRQNSCLSGTHSTVAAPFLPLFPRQDTSTAELANASTLIVDTTDARRVIRVGEK